jgi:ATP-dependent Zn protease
MLEIVNEGTKRARQIIEEKKDIVEQLAKELL